MILVVLVVLVVTHGIHCRVLPAHFSLKLSLTHASHKDQWPFDFNIVIVVCRCQWLPVDNGLRATELQVITDSSTVTTRSPTEPPGEKVGFFVQCVGTKEFIPIVCFVGHSRHLAPRAAFAARCARSGRKK